MPNALPAWCELPGIEPPPRRREELARDEQRRDVRGGEGEHAGSRGAATEPTDVGAVRQHRQRDDDDDRSRSRTAPRARRSRATVTRELARRARELRRRSSAQEARRAPRAPSPARGIRTGPASSSAGVGVGSSRRQQERMRWRSAGTSQRASAVATRNLTPSGVIRRRRQRRNASTKHGDDQRR